MKRLILVLMGLVLAYIVNAQAFPTREGYFNYMLQNDTINILPSDEVFKLNVYVDDTCSVDAFVVGKVSTLDDIVTDTIILSPGYSYTVGGEWSRRIDSVTIISPTPECTIFITTLEK